jgi:HPt (histidine-containing phosphotransfer) domain-containing protein
VQAFDASVLDGLRQFGGPALIAQLITLYREQVAVRTAAMRAALDGGDVSQLRQAAHALKGSAAQVGAASLAAACGALEVAARTAAGHEAPVLVDRVTAAAADAEAWLQANGFPH